MNLRLSGIVTWRLGGLLTVAGLATALAVSGCGSEVPGQDAKIVQGLSSRTLVAGINEISLPTGQFDVFEVDVAVDQDIEIVVLPTEGAILGLGLAVSPDGGEFSAYPGARLTSRAGRFRVAPESAGADGTGFRFLGTAHSAGTWRFSILAQPRIDLATLAGTIKLKSLVESFFLWLYLLNDQPALTGSAADLLYWAFPEIIMLHEPLDITVRVTAAGAGEYIDPDDVADGDASDGTGDNGSDDSGDGSDDGSSGDGSSDGDGDGSDDGDDGDAGDIEDTPPPTALSVEAIVRTGDAVPGQNGATFTYFGNPVIDNEGRVAFYATYDGGTGTGGLYVWEEGTLQSIYDADPDVTGVVPGMGSSDRFGQLTIGWDNGSLHLAWGSDGRLLFVSRVNGLSQPNALFRWRASDGDLLLVNHTELMRTAIPDSTSDFLAEFYHPGVSDDGTAMFSNRYTYFRENGSFVMFEHGIFTTDAVTTEEIGVGAVPEQSEWAIFSDKPVLPTTHNADGEFIFQAAYSQSADGNRGVYRLQDGQLSRVVDNASDRAFSGLAVGTQVGAPGENYEAIAIGPKGHIAIETTLTINDQTRETILRWNGSTWAEFRTISDPNTFDLLTGINISGRTAYLADGSPLLGDNQNLINLDSYLPAALVGVNLNWASFGGAINNHDRAVLRYDRADVEGDAGLLFWTGESLLVVIDGTQPIGLDFIDAIFPVEKRGPDEVDRVGTVVARPETNRPGLSGMLNDRDELVFRAGYLGPDGEKNTADDQQAILFGRGE